MVTNGDNLYDDKFMTELVNAPDDVDAVAYDFYSRYQRPTGPCVCACVPVCMHVCVQAMQWLGEGMLGC